MGAHLSLDIAARAYARYMAGLVREALGEDLVIRAPFPGGGDDFDPIDLDRAAILVVVETIGGTDPAAWGQALALILSVCGDRFLEVCDGGL